MKKEKIIMGMTIRVEIAERKVDETLFEKVFLYFENVDKKFSTYKKDSEISKINQGLVKRIEYSKEMKEIFSLAEETKRDTLGYFDIVTPENKFDTSGIVKGWAIRQAAEILKNNGCRNFYIEAGGDIEVQGKAINSQSWKVGIRNPFKIEEIVKVLSIENKGVATSGNYVRGAHIYNPKGNKGLTEEAVSLTVIGPNIYEADRFATAAFAMGAEGIFFIESLPDFEGYMINKKGVATMTRGFGKYVE